MELQCHVPLPPSFSRSSATPSRMTPILPRHPSMPLRGMSASAPLPEASERRPVPTPAPSAVRERQAPCAWKLDVSGRLFRSAAVQLIAICRYICRSVLLCIQQRYRVLIPAGRKSPCTAQLFLRTLSRWACRTVILSSGSHTVLAVSYSKCSHTVLFPLENLLPP